MCSNSYCWPAHTLSAYKDAYFEDRRGILAYIHYFNVVRAYCGLQIPSFNEKLILTLYYNIQINSIGKYLGKNTNACSRRSELQTAETRFGNSPKERGLGGSALAIPGIL